VRCPLQGLKLTAPSEMSLTRIKTYSVVVFAYDKILRAPYTKKLEAISKLRMPDA
jgi:hypothetical protein